MLLAVFIKSVGKAVGLLVVGLVLCCSDAAVVPVPLVPVDDYVAPVVVAGAPSAASGSQAVSSKTVQTSTTPVLLSRFSSGKVAIGTASGVEGVSLLQEDGVPKQTGGILAMGLRPHGLLLAAETGLFVEQQQVIAYSPLSQSLPFDTQVTAMDVFGDGDEENIWLVTSKGLLRVYRDELTQISITAVTTEPPQRVVMISTTRVLILVRDTAYEVDLTTGVIRAVAKQIGSSYASQRTADGIVYVGGDSGVLVRTSDGTYVIHTLAEKGAPAQLVTGLWAVGSNMWATTKTALVEIGPRGPVARGTLIESVKNGLARDGDGITWVIDHQTLKRYQTTVPVSFEAQVKPVILARCMTCHLDGRNSAPIRNFDKHADAKRYADLIVAKIQSDTGSVMPPANAEPLTQAERNVIVKWYQEGMLP